MCRHCREALGWPSYCCSVILHLECALVHHLHNTGTTSVQMLTIIKQIQVSAGCYSRHIRTNGMLHRDPCRQLAALFTKHLSHNHNNAKAQQLTINYIHIYFYSPCSMNVSPSVALMCSKSIIQAIPVQADVKQVRTCISHLCHRKTVSEKLLSSQGKSSLFLLCYC